MSSLRSKRAFCDRFRVVWMVIFSRQVFFCFCFFGWGRGAAELQELSFCKHDLCVPGDVQLPLEVFWRSHSDACPPPLRLSWPWFRLDVEHARKHEGKGLSVQRILFFYYYSFSLSFHYHLVGRRLSFCFGTHSLHTVGKSLNKKKKYFFFIIGNYKTIITLCVTNVQRKKS